MLDSQNNASLIPEIALFYFKQKWKLVHHVCLSSTEYSGKLFIWCSQNLSNDKRKQLMFEAWHLLYCNITLFPSLSCMLREDGVGVWKTRISTGREESFEKCCVLCGSKERTSVECATLKHQLQTNLQYAPNLADSVYENIKRVVPWGFGRGDPTFPLLSHKNPLHTLFSSRIPFFLPRNMIH